MNFKKLYNNLVISNYFLSNRFVDEEEIEEFVAG